MKIKIFIIALALIALLVPRSFAMAKAKTIPDADHDGLADYDEAIFHTDPNNPDTDGDGVSDGMEVQLLTDPNSWSPDQMQKHIEANLKTQTLAYYDGPYEMGEFKISSGVKGKETPKGTYTILEKIPVVEYKGPGYDFKNTKWNLKFLKGTEGNYYIHGAYWHHNFGHPMSHGCLNVSYANMEPLYNWADVGTVLNIF